MKTITLDKRFTILCAAGEKNAAQVRIDQSAMRAAYPEGCFTLLVKRQDGLIYPIVHEENQPGILTATLTGAETQYPGKLLFEVQMTNGGQLAKSAIYTGYINDSLGDGGEVPEPAAGWITQLLDIAQQVKEAGKVIDALPQMPSSLVHIDENGRYRALALGEGMEIIDGQLRAVVTLG